MDRRSLLKQVAFGSLLFPALSRPGERSLLLRGGLIVNADGRQRADVLVEGEKISAVGNLAGKVRGAAVIDADGLELLPGGIDPHVHLMDPFVDDFASGSRAAIAGGITTLGVMGFENEGEAPSEMIERLERLIRRQSDADVLLHPFLGSPPDAAEVALIAGKGQSSFKLVTAGSDFDCEFSRYVETLERARNIGSLALVHCEDYGVMEEARRRLVAAAQTGLEHYAQSRPVLSEVLAVQKVVALCELTGCAVYVVHLSSERALRVCEDARARNLPVYVETRPIYLYLTAERYRTPDAPLYVGFPPLRDAGDCVALWRGLATGSIHTIGSDHAPRLKSQKLDPHHDIRDPLPGMSDIQAMLPMLYSEGVLKGRLSLERFVAVTSANAAKLFGIYPRKGVIQEGSDADIVAWDPTGHMTIRTADDQSNADFSVFEGWPVTGVPRMALRRGEIVYRDGKFVPHHSGGQLLRRSRGLRI